MRAGVFVCVCVVVLFVDLTIFGNEYIDESIEKARSSSVWVEQLAERVVKNLGF